MSEHALSEQSPYRSVERPKRVRIPHLHALKERGERWAMLTAYDAYTAEIFDEAGIRVLLVGDSAANNVYGYSSTSFRFMKDGGAHAVKLEGGTRFVPQVDALVGAGIPVMAHLGFTPQSEHALGGFRVQGRGEAADRLVEDALALQAAGAFAVVLEMVPADVAKRVTAELDIPTIGIGAGPDCDAQVLVWSDMAGMNRGRKPRFVKQYADVGATLLEAAQRFDAEVGSGVYPAEEHSYT
jgi:3-methyl-2-oxobutanoate hydroxymethyltransferase